jgi:glycosyltransferase involved in cell wall biosynthesis
MNILLVGEYEGSEILSGPQKFAKRLAKELASDHCTTFVAYFQDGKRYSLFKKLFGYEEMCHETQLLILRAGLFPFVFLLLVRHYDIIHIATWARFTALAIFLKPFLRAKIVYTCHTILSFEYKRFRTELPWKFRAINGWIEKIIAGHSDIVIYVSSLLVRLAASEGYVWRNQAVIHHGIDELFFQNSSRHAGSASNSITFIGDIQRKEKGYNFLMDSLRVCKHDIDVTVISDTKKEYTLPLNIHLKFINKMDAQLLALFLSGQDIYVSTSEYDSFSIAAAEAMASGVVPIVTKTTGIAELITSGHNGFIVDYGNTEMLSGVISNLFENRTLLADIAQRTPETVKSYNWNQMSREYSHVYHTLLTAQH